MRSLLENDGYRAAFIGRATDLLNTTLSAESVLAKVDRGAAQLAGDIHYEENRWPSVLDWQTNVQDMRAWVQARPDRMRQELMSKFELTGTVTLEFAPPSGGPGRAMWSSTTDRCGNCPGEASTLRPARCTSRQCRSRAMSLPVGMRRT